MPRWSRRSALRSVATVGSLALAGCSGESSRSNEIPPDRGEPVSDVEVVATAHEEAVSAAEAMFGTEPISVTIEVAFPALESLQDGRYYLERADGDGHGVHRALASFVYARRYAESVPSAVATAVDALVEIG